MSLAAFFCNFTAVMKKYLFKIIAKINKMLLPSLAKRGIDMAQAKKWQMALIGWRYYITKNSLD